MSAKPEVRLLVAVQQLAQLWRPLPARCQPNAMLQSNTPIHMPCLLPDPVSCCMISLLLQDVGQQQLLLVLAHAFQQCVSVPGGGSAPAA